MADKYSVEYNKAFVKKPFEMVEANKFGGRLRNFVATVEVSGELATTDVIFLAKLPSGSRVMGMRVVSPDWGTTGACNIGWLGNGVDAADADGFFAALDCNTAAVDANLGGALPGFNKKFSAPTDIVLVPTAVSTAMNGQTIVVQIVLAID
jgi:hypothetical protein